MNIKMYVCTRCWSDGELIPETKPTDDPHPATVRVEDGVMYVVPHKKECRMLEARS